MERGSAGRRPRGGRRRGRRRDAGSRGRAGRAGRARRGTARSPAPSTRTGLGRALVGQFVGQRHRMPVVAHQRPALGARPDLGDQLVLLVETSWEKSDANGGETEEVKPTRLSRATPPRFAFAVPARRRGARFLGPFCALAASDEIGMLPPEKGRSDPTSSTVPSFGPRKALMRALVSIERKVGDLVDALLPCAFPHHRQSARAICEDLRTVLPPNSSR